MSKPSSMDETHYPSMHIGTVKGLDLPAGEHHFHIKAKVNVHTNEKSGEEPIKTHDLEVTHIKHLGPVDEEKKGSKNPEAALDEEFGKIAKEKLGKNQASNQEDATD